MTVIYNLLLLLLHHVLRLFNLWEEELPQGFFLSLFSRSTKWQGPGSQVQDMLGAAKWELPGLWFSEPEWWEALENSQWTASWPQPRARIFFPSLWAAYYFFKDLTIYKCGWAPWSQPRASNRNTFLFNVGRSLGALELIALVIREGVAKRVCSRKTQSGWI